MSKINQIENALREIEGGEFQKLADSYIHKKGYNNINPVGSVIGANKVRKGTPDTYVRQKNGKFIFAEYTTEQANITSKLQGDLNKCLAEEKTGVPLAKIEEIIFCHTSILSPGDEQALYDIGKQKGVKIQIFGIGSIAFDLYQKYPGLAKDFLGISIDTGQILEPVDFVANTGRSQLATPLDTVFHSREQELEQILKELEDNNLVVISGQTGVGKSRLALQALYNFRDAHPEYETLCIYNRGPDLFEDIRAHFSQLGQFLILVDDANRITQFDYIVDLILNQKHGQTIKVVATVRDYARDKIMYAAKPLGAIPEIGLKPMSTDEIKDLVKGQYNITSPFFLDRISEISGGNPRLAIMAAQVVIKHDHLNSISDVSALYDEYFSSIAHDLENLQDDNIIKVAGIISFFRTVDRSNEEIMRLIQSIFGITSKEFWSSAQTLHGYEVIDIYEHEVVKFSDQVLATYIFYLCFFKNRVLDFDILIDKFFPRQTNRIRDAVYPCLNTFDFTMLEAQMRGCVHKKWQELLDNEDTENLYALIRLFWFLLQTNALMYIRDQIDMLEVASVKFGSIDWEAEKPDTDLHPLLDIIGLFKQAEVETTFRPALDLAFNYVEKIPQAAPQFIHLLTKRFGFSRHSHFNGYTIQRILIDALWLKADKGQNELFSRLFIAIAKRYLPTRYDSHEVSDHSVTIHNFELLETEPILELRKTVWNGIFHLYQQSTLQNEALDVLRGYTRAGYYLTQKGIVEKDADLIIPFIRDYLAPNKFTDCLVVQDFFSMLDRRDIPGAKTLHKRYRNRIYDLYKLITYDHSDALDMSFRDYEEHKRQEIKDLTSKYTFDDYLQFMNDSKKILSYVNNNDGAYEINTGIMHVLLDLSERSGSLFREVIQEYLKLGNILLLQQPTIIVNKLLDECGADNTYKILAGIEYPEQRKWLFGYYMCLAPEDIYPETINDLYVLYQNAVCGELPYDCDYLLKYTAVDSIAVVKTVSIILNKTESNDCFKHDMYSFFNTHSEINEQIISLFEGRLDILEKAYLVHIRAHRNADYSGVTLSRILSRNQDFILKYIDQIYDSGGGISSYEETRDYTFLWKHDNCDYIVLSAVEHILQHEKDQNYMLGGYLKRLFCIHETRERPKEVTEKQDEFLTSIIQKEAKNTDLIALIFKPISYFSSGKRKYFVELFLKYNKEFDDFERLRMEPDVYSWTGSAIPMYQAKLDYWESLLPLCNIADLLQHRLYIERHIQGYRKAMETEKKSDFMEDRF